MTFCGVQFWERFPGASEGPRVEFWTLFWRVLGHLFAVSEKLFVQYVKKCVFGPFLRAKSKGRLLQKHAIRTVHPPKIDDELSKH